MDFKQAVKKSASAMKIAIPMITGILILVSIFNVLVPKSSYHLLFRGGVFDPLIGAALGSVIAGNPVSSYIISGDLLRQGISLIAVTAFLVSWVTVGIFQLPIEIEFLGKKFALVRNISAFVLSLVVAVLTVIGVNIL